MPSRILERAFTKALGAQATTACPQCGWPARQGKAVVLLNNDEELESCGSCEGPVDAAGQSLGTLHANGERYLKVIALADGPALTRA